MTNPKLIPLLAFTRKRTQPRERHICNALPVIIFKKRRGGFTLIELLVVIVIIAVLMAIAIPAYLSQRKKGQETQTKNSLAIALRSSRAAALDNNGAFPAAAVLAPLVTADQPHLTITQGAGCGAFTDPGSPNSLLLDSTSTSDLQRFYGYANGIPYMGSVSASGGSTLFTKQPGCGAAGSYYSQVVGDSPAAFWRFEEDGSAAVDSSGGYTGTYTGSASHSSTGALANGDHSLSLNGAAGGYVNFGSIFNFVTPTNNYSIEAWVKLNSTASDYAIIDNTHLDGAAKRQGWGISFLNSGGWGLTFWHWQNNGVSLYASSAAAYPVSAGTWYHVVGTFNGTTRNSIFYVNGTQVDSGVGFPMPYVATDLRIGSTTDYAALNPLNGSVDDVAIYNSVLSPAQITAHYAARLSAN